MFIFFVQEGLFCEDGVASHRPHPHPDRLLHASSLWHRESPPCRDSSHRSELRLHICRCSLRNLRAVWTKQRWRQPQHPHYQHPHWVASLRSPSIAHLRCQRSPKRNDDRVGRVHGSTVLFLDVCWVGVYIYCGTGVKCVAVFENSACIRPV